MSDFLDFSTVKRPKTPNTYLVAPPGYADQASPDAEAPLFNCTAEELFGRVEGMVSAHKRWELKAADPSSGRLYFIAISKIFKFKDDIDIAVMAGPAGSDKSRIAIYSRSRVGHSDLGANEKRVREILDTLALP
ncbi:hypothetical protein HY29_16440 [Hyphomonas beringensis]|uniref:DUF1499 domain-containing protein n=1 Tax=Hyphomonas beringensis TaxID=1280946 RepID=A0A062UC35_9PROT|nr:DUF1499 domain-containing protein [Hyphomonas beringensis]KCZ53660.1 hypothetical protein HY29_16440 [Hyphomonas beringensis]